MYQFVRIITYIHLRPDGKPLAAGPRPGAPCAAPERRPPVASHVPWPQKRDDHVHMFWQIVHGARALRALSGSPRLSGFRVPESLSMQTALPETTSLPPFTDDVTMLQHRAAW